MTKYLKFLVYRTKPSTTSSQVPIPELSLPEGGAAVQEDANYICRQSTKVDADEIYEDLHKLYSDSNGTRTKVIKTLQLEM
jgi:hypothetical protein